MPWYKSPIRPLDPIVQDDPDSEAIRYYVSDFSNTGQESYYLPPAQDQAMWQALTNVMPPITRTLQRRYGIAPYTKFSLGTSGATRMYAYQRDIDMSRRILLSSPTAVGAISEDGNSSYSVYTPTAGIAPRAIVSRSTAYFFNGNSSDSNKWDGSTVSNWGIDIAASAATGPVGPNYPSASASAGSGVAWSNPNNANTDNGLPASCSVSLNNQSSQQLQMTNFGFTLLPAAVIRGLKADVKIGYSVSGNTGSGVHTFTVVARLLKNGVAYGTAKTLLNVSYTGNPATGLVYYTLGSASDMWGGSFTPNDLNASNFGIELQATWTAGAFGTVTVNVDTSRLTVYNTTTQITATPNAGQVTLSMGRTYYYAFKNSATGHISDISVASNSTGAGTNKSYTLSVPTATDPQVDTTMILATADGGDPSILYLVAEIPSSTASYVDNTPEATLESNQQIVYTDPLGDSFGCVLNTPPPEGTLGIKHKGRLYLAVGQYLYFSKNVGEMTLPNGYIAGRYEEAWPAANFMDISEGAETVTGLLSDGDILYIGTQFHVRRLYGDSPDNFQKPEIVHQQAGVLNQEVWQMVYVEGSPVGAIWLSPDLRIIGSDFNTYTDIGTPIQDVLNTINQAAVNSSWAMFVSDAPYDLYILAVPTGTSTQPNTFLVFDMRSRRWVTWTAPTNNPFTAGVYNITVGGTPQWLLGDASGLGTVRILTPGLTTDSITGARIPVTATTSWLHLGSPTTRKLLNEIEVIGDVASTLVTVQGASTQSDFNAPTVAITGVLPVKAPFGGYKVYLASRLTKTRYYQFSFQNSGTSVDVLDGFNVKVLPLHTV